MMYSVDTIRYNEGGCNSTGYSADALFETEDEALDYIKAKVKEAENLPEYFKLSLDFAIGRWIKSEDGQFLVEKELRHVFEKRRSDKEGRFVDEQYSDISNFIWD